MKNSTLGVMAIGQIAGNAVEDFVTPTVAGLIPATYTSLYGYRSDIANAAMGVVGIVIANKAKMKDDVKLGVAVISTKLLADAVYDAVITMANITKPAPVLKMGGYSQPMVRVASISPSSSSYNSGVITVD